MTCGIEVFQHTIATDVDWLSTYLYEPLTHFCVCFLFFHHRPICLTSKCMHTSLPSPLRPPSGAAVRGFAAAASCYDVKTTAPLYLSPRPSYALPAARHLTPDLLSPSWPAVIDYMLVPPLPHHHTSLWSCRERERANNTAGSWVTSPKSIFKSPHHTHTHMHYIHRLTLKNVSTFLVCAHWAHQY